MVATATPSRFQPPVITLILPYTFYYNIIYVPSLVLDSIQYSMVYVVVSCLVVSPQGCVLACAC